MEANALAAVLAQAELSPAAAAAAYARIEAGGILLTQRLEALAHRWDLRAESLKEAATRQGADRDWSAAAITDTAAFEVRVAAKAIRDLVRP